MNRYIFGVTGLIIAATLVSCSSGPSVSDDEPAEQQVVSGLDAEIAGLVATSQTPFVLRVQPGEWSSVQPFLNELPEVVPVRPRDREALETLTEDGLLVQILDYLEVSGAGYVDESRSAWLTAGVVGADAALRSAKAGIGWLPQSEDPAGHYLRLVIPTDDPAAAAAHVESSWSDSGSRDAMRVEPLERHIHIDILDIRVGGDNGGNKLRADQLWEFIDQETPEPAAQTPALRAFVDAEAPVAVYTRTRQLRDYGAAQMAFDAGAAVRMATPENQQRMRAMGASGLLNLYRVSPRSEREFEDFAFIAHASGEAGLTVDAVATRTARGRDIYESGAAEVALPRFSHTALPDERVLVDLSWSEDFTAALAQDDGQEGAGRLSLEAVANGSFGTRGLQRLQMTMGRITRSLGWVGLAGLAQSPSYLPRMMLEMLGDELRSLVPVAIRARFVQAEANSEAGLPLGGALAVRFAGSREALDTVIASYESAIEYAESAGVNYRIVEAADGAVELHLALGHELDEVLGQPEVVAPGLNIDMHSRQIGGPYDEPIAAFGPISPVSLRSAHSSIVARWRLASGADAATPDALDAERDLVENPPACLDDLITEGIALFEGYERTPPDAAVADIESTLAPYDAAANACADQAPEQAEQMRWATGRARWLLGQRAMRTTLHQVRRAVRKCKEGESWSCAYLNDGWDDGRYPGEIERAHESATTLLTQACERGDEVACAQKEEIPALEELTWRHGEEE
ncbi:MAG: hypothetical protein ACLFVJ_17025 [Persicimonas sp.]